MEIKKTIIAALAASLIFQMPAAIAQEQNEDPAPSPPYFSDVEEGNPYYLPINYLFEQGIINGYEDGTFKPYQNVNRAEALKMIILAFDIEAGKKAHSPLSKEDESTSEEITGTTNHLSQKTSADETSSSIVKFKDLNSGEVTELRGDTQEPATKAEEESTRKTTEINFNDVDKNAWFSGFVTSAVQNQLVSGYSDGSFKPDKTISLVEALKINLEADKALIPQELPQEIFTDVSGTEWYSGYVLYAKDKSILNISLDNKIDPHQEMTRGKLAELIYRIQKSKEGYKFGVASYYGDKFNGRNTASGEPFDNKAMTAAHKKLPFGTIVRVSNPKFSKYVDVKITDRGPYAYGRVLDLSKAAFEVLEHPGAGLTRIEYKVMSQEDLDKEREELIKSAY